MATFRTPTAHSLAHPCSAYTTILAAYTTTATPPPPPPPPPTPPPPPPAPTWTPFEQPRGVLVSSVAHLSLLLVLSNSRPLFFIPLWPTHEAHILARRAHAPSLSLSLSLSLSFCRRLSQPRIDIESAFGTLGQSNLRKNARGTILRRSFLLSSARPESSSSRDEEQERQTSWRPKIRGPLIARNGRGREIYVGDVLHERSMAIHTTHRALRYLFYFEHWRNIFFSFSAWESSNEVPCLDSILIRLLEILLPLSIRRVLSGESELYTMLRIPFEQYCTLSSSQHFHASIAVLCYNTVSICVSRVRA